MGYLEELSWRDLLHQMTGEKELRDHLGTPGRIGYCGFDPTADSLTIGNLIPIKMLMHFQQTGHKPIVLMGSGTGLIGDPSGKDDERQLLTLEQVEHNIACQKKIFEPLLDFDPANPNAAVMVNNYDWLGKLGYIDVLRDVGKHFSVNVMIQKDSVRERLHGREQGISYTEFSYMVLQAYDFLHLRREMNCTLQVAGSDQYGNIVAGIDLIRREFGHEEGEAYGVTAPMVTKADGKKIGKTETGAVWLTADRTSPYAFYQFWINASDQDVIPFLKWYTLLGEEEIADLESQHQAQPHLRVAHHTLASYMTKMLHGEKALADVEAATKALFSGDVRRLDQSMLEEILADVPNTTHDKTLLEAEGVSLVELLPLTSLAQSKREAREFLGNGAVMVNGERIEADRRLTGRDLLHGMTILLRRGKKSWHATRWQ
ncbi:MAG: tyrosine--tRNA ligase [Planctomycetes bacterium]|nr:tyrosine--tRNA ligase [Planctomycetota bacterium]